MHRDLVAAELAVRAATARHNAFLKELGLPLLPSCDADIAGATGDADAAGHG